MTKGLDGRESIWRGALFQKGSHVYKIPAKAGGEACNREKKVTKNLGGREKDEVP